MNLKTRKILIILGILGWFYYLLITIFFYNYIMVLLLAGITVALPTLLLSFRKRNKPQRRVILRRRVIVTGFILGLITFTFFPNIFRLPSQIHRRLDRCNTLITPDNPTVLEFREKMFNEFGGEIEFYSYPIRTQLDLVNYYTLREIVWQEDMISVLMAGDLSTPEEAIIRGRDDCRGHAVVMASILIGMGYDAWVVEMAWHWYVKVFYAGNVYNVNQEGSQNSSKIYPELMMFNNEEIILLQNPWGIYHGLMISSPNFYGYLEIAGPALIIIVILLGVGAGLYSMVCMGDLSLVIKKNKEACRKLKKRILIGIVSFSSLIGLLLFLYFTPAIEFIGLYLFVYGTSTIITLMNLEELNEKMSK